MLLAISLEAYIRGLENRKLVISKLKKRVMIK